MNASASRAAASVAVSALLILVAASPAQAATWTVVPSANPAAFDNVFATMDAVDTFRAQAIDSMAQTVQALEGQIQRAQPYLERTRRNEIAGG